MGWEDRDKKLESKRKRMRKHGRSLMTAIADAERKAVETLQERRKKKGK